MADRETSKVLVVDDNAQNRALAQATLEDEGFDVIAASGGEEGFLKFTSEQPDCILLDVRMPDLDGFQVCKRVRNHPQGADVPIVFLTALRDVETFDQALRAGGDDFLTKPVRPTELVIRVQTALKLRRVSAELREHYELVRHQRDDLMRLQLQKERLSAFVVHDLKNPVNSINLCAQAVLLDRTLSDSSRDAMQHIRSDARALLRLILNLLDISKSEERALVAQARELRLEALASEVLEAVEVRARATQVHLVRNIEVPAVHADEDLLRRILENLLENAIRHAPPGSAVTLSATAGTGEVLLSVSDSGPGIPTAMRERIFDRYVQIEPGERSVSRMGQGLGLTFCKLAVEAQSGSIWVEDANPGARFCVRLPQ